MIDRSAAEVGAERWLRNSVRVYLEGEKNIHWISRAIRGSEREAAMVLLTTFSRFNGTHRYRKLLRSLSYSVKDSAKSAVWLMHSS